MSQESDKVDLKKKAEEVFDLSYLEELQLWLAWRVIKRKADKIMNGNHAVTILGVVAAVLNYSLVMLQNGTPIPQNSRDWIMFGLSAALAALGALAKASTVGSQPGDPPTKARIAGALEKGEKVPPEAIVESVAASHTVDILATNDGQPRAGI